jgi:uncharacterized membrane protein YbjE (DUF340 family)
MDWYLIDACWEYTLKDCTKIVRWLIFYLIFMISKQLKLQFTTVILKLYSFILTAFPLIKLRILENPNQSSYAHKYISL